MLDGVISASHASKRVMELRFNLPCPNHVVINRIKTPAGIDTAPKTLSQPVRIGTASRLVSLKGISVSLLMMQELLRRGHDVTLEVAGKGRIARRSRRWRPGFSSATASPSAVIRMTSPASSIARTST